MNLLEGLANEMNLSDAISAYFSGEPINQTEGREVLHTALRAPASAQIYADGLDVVPEVQNTPSNQKLDHFVTPLFQVNTKDILVKRLPKLSTLELAVQI